MQVRIIVEAKKIPIAGLSVQCVDGLAERPPKTPIQTEGEVPEEALLAKETYLIEDLSGQIGHRRGKRRAGRQRGHGGNPGGPLDAGAGALEQPPDARDGVVREGGAIDQLSGPGVEVLARR